MAKILFLWQGPGEDLPETLKRNSEINLAGTADYVNVARFTCKHFQLDFIDVYLIFI